MKKRLATLLCVLPLAVLPLTSRAEPERDPFGYAWGQPLPAECHWKWGEDSRGNPIAVYPEGCVIPWLTNFAAFWEWFTMPREPWQPKKG